jgi:hypothetical protein
MESNWMERYTLAKDATNRPTDQEFREHFEKLLNPSERPQSPTPGNMLYIPILDDHFTPVEVDAVIQREKKPRLSWEYELAFFRSIPRQWLVFLTDLFNAVFSSASYPSQWSTNRLTASSSSSSLVVTLTAATTG